MLAKSLLPSDEELADETAELQLPPNLPPAHSNESGQQQSPDENDDEGQQQQQQQQQQIDGSRSNSGTPYLSQQHPQDQDVDRDQQQQQQQQGASSDASELAADIEAITQEQYGAASDDEASLPAASYAYSALVEQVRLAAALRLAFESQLSNTVGEMSAQVVLQYRTHLLRSTPAGVLAATLTVIASCDLLSVVPCTTMEGLPSAAVHPATSQPPLLLPLLLVSLPQGDEAVRGELRLLHRCEVLAGPPSDGRVMRWADHLLVQQAVTLPRWHAWQAAAGVAGLAEAVGMVRVRPATGPLYTVSGAGGCLR
jgi:hypothetical protein